MSHIEIALRGQSTGDMARQEYACAIGEDDREADAMMNSFVAARP
jgi:hypothetical protein